MTFFIQRLKPKITKHLVNFTILILYNLFIKLHLTGQKLFYHFFISYFSLQQNNNAAFNSFRQLKTFTLYQIFIQIIFIKLFTFNYTYIITSQSNFYILQFFFFSLQQSKVFKFVLFFSPILNFYSILEIFIPILQQIQVKFV